KDPNPFIAARAVWLLAQLGPAGVAKVTPLLEAKGDTLRVVWSRALRRANQNVLANAKKMATDPSAAIRREVALTLRDVPLDHSSELQVQIGRLFDGKDRTYLEAWGTGCQGKEREVYAAVANSMGASAEQWSDTFAWIAWRLGSPDAGAAFKARAFPTKLTEPQRKLMTDAL